jgi:hypothetical protein
MSLSSSTDSQSKAGLPVRILSSTRVFPVNRIASASPTVTVTVVPLSIADNKCDGFGFTTAVWLYDPDPDSDVGLKGEQKDSRVGDVSLLRSLEATLSLFPWWCGSLSRCPPAGSLDFPATPDTVRDSDLPAHCLRFGRLLLTYGAETDPGVAMVVADCSLRLAEVVPTPDELAVNGAWHCRALVAADLCKPTPLLLQEGNSSTGSSGPPCMMVQLTTFECGSRAVAVRIAHALADVPSIAGFVRHWSEEHRAMITGLSHISDTRPLFDPQLLDQAAAGDIDAAQPEAALLEVAHRLPLERWDRWSSAAGCPESLADQHVVPPGVNPEHMQPPGAVIEWCNWDPTVPCDYYALHFAADELQRMRLEATTPAFTPSTLLALSAHLWSAICVARGLADDGGTAQFVCNIGLRSRLPSPLPSTFIGSPVLEVTTRLPASIVCSKRLADLASAIHQTISKFNGATMPPLLHSFAYEDHPSRWCHGMWGRRHVALTAGSTAACKTCTSRRTAIPATSTPASTTHWMASSQYWRPVSAKETCWYNSAWSHSR